ncbi:hypothetical protein [Collimonas humicola]|uniref:hypothetical protein n=1 Tax=Collimonas humicola TaxID=2825886 RepID=UPI001B8BF9A0|nr:hypothetical protein [Collimonas humicola]
MNLLYSEDDILDLYDLVPKAKALSNFAVSIRKAFTELTQTGPMNRLDITILSADIVLDFKILTVFGQAYARYTLSKVGKNVYGKISFLHEIDGSLNEASPFMEIMFDDQSRVKLGSSSALKLTDLGEQNGTNTVSDSFISVDKSFWPRLLGSIMKHQLESLASPGAVKG